MDMTTCSNSPVSSICASAYPTTDYGEDDGNDKTVAAAAEEEGKVCDV